MKNKINDSISFLLAEYKRLQLKEQDNTISKEEKEALKKIAFFIGKSNE